MSQDASLVDQIISSPCFDEWKERLNACSGEHDAWKEASRGIAAEVDQALARQRGEASGPAAARTAVMARLSQVAPCPPRYPWLPNPDPPPRSSVELYPLVTQQYPLPIALPYSDFADDPDLGPLLDTFEALLHYLAVVALSAYCRDHPFDASHNMRLLTLLVNHSQWSTGRLLEILRDTVAVYRSRPQDLPYPRLYALLFDRRAAPTESQASLATLLETRNKAWGHGGCRSREHLLTLLPDNRRLLEGVLSHCDWLKDCPLVIPTRWDHEGNLLEARSLMGARRGPSFPFTCAATPGETVLGGAVDESRRVVVLCAPKLDGYLPLHPFSVVPSYRGPFFLHALEWKTRATSLDRARFKCYAGHEQTEHGETHGEAVTRAIEEKVQLLERHSGQGAAAAEATRERHQARVSFDLPEVAAVRAAMVETFVGREAELARLVNLVGLPASAPRAQARVVLVRGCEGQGKSALLCKTVQDAQALRVPTLHHMVHLHKDPRCCLQFLVWTALELLSEEPDARLECADLTLLRSALYTTLVRLGERFGGVLVVVDGLDELEPRDQDLDFLPLHLPAPCTLVLAGLPDGIFASAVRRRYPGLATFDLDGLAHDDALMLAERWWEKATGAPLPNGVVSAIPLLRERSAGRPFLFKLHLEALVAHRQGGGLHHDLPVSCVLDVLPESMEAWFTRQYRDLADKGDQGFTTRRGSIRARLLHLLAVARDPLAPEALTALIGLAGLPGTDAAAHPVHLEEVCDALVGMASSVSRDATGRFRIDLPAFGQYLRTSVLGTSDTAWMHSVFSRWLDRPALSLAPYALLHRVAHAAGADVSDLQEVGARLDALLQDFVFLQARVEAGQVFPLLRDYDMARAPSSEVCAWRGFLDRHSHLLARDPGLFHALALDLPADHPVERAARSVPPRAPVLRRMNRPAAEESDPFLRALGGHARSVRAVAVARDGHLAASADADGNVRAWEIATGQERISIPRLRRAVTALAFSDDAGILAAGGDDGSLHAWHLADATPLDGVLRDDVPLRDLRFLDGPWLLGALDERGVVRVWDFESHALVAELRPGCDGEASFDSARGRGFLRARSRDLAEVETPWGSRVFLPRFPWASVAQEARVLVTCQEDDEVTLQSLACGASPEVVFRAAVPIVRTAVDDNATLALVAGEDGNLGVVDAETRQVRQVISAHAARVRDVAVDPAGRCAVTAGDDGLVRVWDLAVRPATARPRPPAAPIVAACASRDGTRALTLAEDGTCKTWIPQEAHVTAGVKVVAVATNLMAVGSSDGRVTVLDPVSGALFTDTSAASAEVTCLALASGAQALVAGTADGSLRAWDVEARTVAFTVDLAPTRARALAFTPGHQAVVAACDDHTVRILSARTGEAKGILVGHEDAVHAVQVTPDGVVVSASADGTIRAWSAGETRKLFTFDTGVVHRRLVMAVHPRGRRVVAGCADGSLRAWDLETGRLVWAVPGHERDILAVAWSPDGRRLVTGGTDGTARAWDAATGRMLATHHARGGVRACVALAGEMFLCGDDGGVVSILHLEGPLSLPVHLAPAVPERLHESSQAQVPPLLALSTHAMKRRVETVRPDYHQRMVAKALPDEPQLIAGMAGSGKTLVLVYHAIIKARYSVPPRRILFVCFNLALSRYVRDLLQANVEEKACRRIQVFAFYELCGWLLGEEVHHAADRAYYRGLLARAHARARDLPREQKFDSILVDEGQDLDDDMFEFLVLLRDASLDYRDFKVAMDATQDLFSRHVEKSEYAWGRDRHRVNLTARRQRVLPVSHRSSRQIVEYACSLLGKAPPVYGADDGQQLFAPCHFGRSGAPVVEKTLALEPLVRFVAGSIAELLEKDESPAEIGILYPRDLERQGAHLQSLTTRMVDELQARAIPVRFFSASAETKLSFNVEESTVKLGSIYAAKGLDFRVVFLLDIPDPPAQTGSAVVLSERTVQGTYATLMFVGATRARDILHVLTLS